jgi:DNA-binding MarR family transcriptional regulator
MHPTPDLPLRDLNPADCTCLAVRQAARHVTQFYDQYLAPTGLRSTQYSILSRLKRTGPLSINDLAAALVMDRTTLGRNMLPLQRDGLIAIEPDAQDRRSKALRLTPAGVTLQRTASKQWEKAQKAFEKAYGPQRTVDLRTMLGAVTAAPLDAGSVRAAARA